MADPQAAALTQLHNIQTKTGKSIAALQAVVVASGLAKHADKRSLLMDQFKLGYGDANAVVLMIGKPMPGLGAVGAAAGAKGAAPAAAAAADDSDPLDSLYTGAKAALRPLHEAVMKALQTFGPFEVAPKKAYVSLRRKKQFAMLGPATKDLIELGLNAKGLPMDARLKPLPAGGMCQYSVRIGSAAEVDATLLAWARTAYDAAG